MRFAASLTVLRVGLPLALLLSLSAACAGESQPGPGPRAKVYRVRGEVLALPTPTQPELLVRHEAIDDFAGRDGRAIGMDAMTMSFPLRQGLDPAPFPSGSRVTLDLAVDWEANPPIAIVALEPLSDSTPLEYRPSRPRAATQAGEADPAATPHHHPETP